MKFIFVLAAIVYSFATYSQDTKKIKSIDSLVKVIKASNYQVIRDTVKRESAKTGFSRRVYVTALFNEVELKKYVEDDLITSVGDNRASKMHLVSSYYFDHNKLIKVEQNRTDWLGTKYSDWYFGNDKPLYNTSKQRYRDQYALTMLDEANRMVQDMGFN
jgi:hypothetical protein